MNNLSQKVSNFIEHGAHLDDLNDLFTLAIGLNNDESLIQVSRLVKSDYGGYTYKWELKNSAAVAILNWEVKGLDKLKEIVFEPNCSFANISVITGVLAYVASGQIIQLPNYAKGLYIWRSMGLNSEKFKTKELRQHAKKILIDCVIEIDKEEKLPYSVMHSLSKPFFTPEAQEEIFSAGVMRWLKFSNKGIEDYNSLIYDSPRDEIYYHLFLKEHGYLLEPFYSEIWSKPRFGESYQPDFVVKSIDNSYTVIEIEKPYQNIITKNGNLSKEAIHARRQALEYREWVILNLLYAKNKFPDIWRPTALVVIGLETNLADAQKDRLRQENESTQGIVKIVGFDWLYSRAKSTLENLIDYNSRVSKVND
ncbi:Shedu anti-phage system protein SduA domain-containing protein [Flavobacterium litorale]|uniref:DUF4263 domain-containing protein n=1 Tax=Flavobacterium litorale TaxID=2856519 RepID=A0ABX8V957_9FLAO|nr:Shedu anti-phage system protein SduA domain-containing protein [Flavobacterium litorale]QYJ67723.1 DUF4263 domain-containing protein [Flavobacterium litorale]